MERISLRPNRKLLNKQFYVLLTITAFNLFLGLLLQILIPLGKATPEQVSIILWPILIGLIILMWIIATPIIFLWVKNLEYFIEEERIRIHKGILTKIQQNIPYRAVTDFQLHRSLYDRFLGIGSIRIQTAGQTQSPTGYEANIAGLVDWDNLMLELRKRLKRFHGEAITDKEGEERLETSDDVFEQILIELREIKKVLKDR
jgi:uncharacterized membrane protein YdbT with pleckstrin-like domain